MRPTSEKEESAMADLKLFRADTRQWLLDNSPVGVRGLVLLWAKATGRTTSHVSKPHETVA